MKWTFKLRNEPVTMTVLDGVVAVQPTEKITTRAKSRASLVRRFGMAARDDNEGGSFGHDLPSQDRKAFEQAGWVFVESQKSLARAAATRTTVEDARAVRHVFLNRSGNPLVATDQLTVQLPLDMSDREARAQLRKDGLKLVRPLRFARNAFLVRLPARKPLLEAIEELQAKNRYRFVEPDLLQVISGRRQPADPHYDRQWQHANDGATSGVAGADISSEAAWDRTLGVSPVRPIRVAVIDNGMQVNHPDLKDGILAGGYFESDFQGNQTFVRFRPGDSGFPDAEHGTFCMGMAGARLDNGRGGCGSAPGCDLIPIACLADQVGSQTTLARAVAYAADPTREDSQASAEDGADVIACSLGPNGADWELTSALDLAITFAAAAGRNGLGAPIFWAVSNGSFDIERDEVSAHPEVISVGRSNRNDEADGSAFGSKLELLAPGAQVYSTRSGSRYGLSTGTSYAAPLAAGVAALVLSRHPDWTRDQVRRRMRQSADKVGGVTYNAQGRHDEYGFGRINAERAVT